MKKNRADPVCAQREMKERITTLAHYVIKKGVTVRQAAEVYGVSKSTVHKDLSQRLENVDPALFEKVRVVLDKNKAERHIRGGQATKMKYLNKI